MNIMMRGNMQSRGDSRSAEKKQRDREVVRKILQENEKFRTKQSFYSGGAQTHGAGGETLTSFGGAGRANTTIAPYSSKGFGNTTLGSFGNSERQLKVYPEEIIFKDVRENQTYEINVKVRNLTKTVKRIRVTPPKSISKFRCDYDKLGIVASGLFLELIVSFSTTQPGEFHDSIVLMTDSDYKVEIPLHAYSPMSNIVFEPFINMGFVPLDTPHTQKIMFHNQGEVDGRVELRYSDLPDFKIEPSTFKIKKKSSTSVEATYYPKVAGIFRGIVEVYLDGQSFTNHIDVNATSVEYLRFIVDEEGIEMNKVEFGEIFFGQKKEIKGFLVNNSPEPLKFKINFIHGLHNNYDEKNNRRTPMQEGLQQTQRVMQVIPNEGVIDTYSQMPITFKCLSKVQENNVLWVKKNCFKRNRVDNKTTIKGGKSVEEIVEYDESSKTNHEYTALFNFEGVSESKLLMMDAQCICPRVSFGEESHFDFASIKVNEIACLNLMVSNMHKNLEVDIDFPNVSVFYVNPPRLHLGPGDKSTIQMYFQPRSLGKFTRKVEFLINGLFPVPITFTGTANDIAKKQKRVAGPLPIDFSKYDEKTYLEMLEGSAEDRGSLTELSEVRTRAKSKTLYPFKPNPRIQRVAETTTESKLPYIDGNSINPNEINNYQVQQKHKEDANDYLKEMRDDRELKKKKAYIVTQNKLRADRVKFYLGKAGAMPGENSVQVTEEKIDSPRMKIPNSPDTLFVMKPIGSYEPYSIYNFSEIITPDYVNMKPFLDKPESHGEARDIISELTGEELQKIQVGSNHIDFGSIFVKSTDTRYFQVRNDLRKSIAVRVSNDHYKELENTYQKTQIIPSGRTASFKIEFSSIKEQEFERTITYYINEKYSFKILVTAEVTPVILLLKNYNEDFTFDEDSLEMESTRDVEIINNGNAVASFDWMESKTGCFIVEPSLGHVNPRSSTIVKVTYTPSGVRLIDEEELYMRVVDGKERALNCKANLPEVKVEWLTPVINFGIMCVSERKLMTAALENKQSKSAVVYSVDINSLFPGIEVSPLKDKINPDDIAKFELTFCSNQPVNFTNKEIKVNLRGSQPAALLVNAQTIIPDVYVQEPEFNFGEVTFGNTEGLPLTIVNDSPIDVTLTLDLREREDLPASAQYRMLSIKYEGQNDADDEMVLDEKELDDIGRNQIMDGQEQEDDMLGESEENIKEPVQFAQSEGSRFFVIKLKKKRTYNFSLKFTPEKLPQKFVGRDNEYKISLPLALAGYGHPLTDLMRKVYCRAIIPKLIMEPANGEVIFDKKIITSTDAVAPQHASITFTNSHSSHPLPFEIGISQLKNKDIFTLIPTIGTIDPQVPVTIKVMFKPSGNRKYEEELPLYLDDLSKPYTWIKLYGEGAYPRILFDRHEVIMPIVPLGIESKTVFRIENEGYQNVSLKYDLAQDIGVIDLKVKLPDGKNLGTTNNSIRVELSFVSDKPISFTTKLVFEDESKLPYSIFVSGTSDNCILTNFPFFQTMNEDYRLVADGNRPIKMEMMEEDMDSELQENTDPHGLQSPSKPSSVTGGKSYRSYAINIDQNYLGMLERACQHCLKWLNTFVLSYEITNFPADVVSSNGQQVYELISFLTKKGPPQQAKIDAAQKKHSRVDSLHKQYSDLLYFLKENGAMLNTIRPEYLLSHHDLNTWYKNHKNPCTSNAALRNNDKNFYRYLSMEAWSTLFYQILKIYYLCRVSGKVFRGMKELPSEKPLFPEGYSDHSPVYSPSEIILLRWIELAVDRCYPANSKRYINFDMALRDGLAIGALLEMYIGNTGRKLFALKTSFNSDEDMKSNIEKIKAVIREYGLPSMPDLFESGKPSSREWVLYLSHLFQVLPFFLPKPPLEFPVMLKGTCIRQIMLQNPSKKKIVYGVRLDGGASDFAIEKDTVEIEPNTQVPFNIKYTARLSKQIKARITFKNKRESGAQATPLVFDLVSEVQGRQNEEVVKVDTEVQLYKSATFEVQVNNPFPHSVLFHIRVENVPVILEEPKKKKLGRRGKEDERVFLPAFFCKAATVSIGKNGQTKIPVYYLPVTMEPHKCNLIFIDEKVGEIQIELNGEPTPPVSINSKPTKVVASLDNLETQFIDIARKNQDMEEALSKLRDRIKDSNNMPNKEEIISRLDRLKDFNQFYLECDQLFVQIPSTLTIPSSSRKADVESSRLDRTDSKLSTMETGVKLPINLNYKYPVQGQPAQILMRNSTRTDVRIYQLDVTVTPKKVKAMLEMITPARVALTQVIPVINTLETDVSVISNITRSKNGEAFKLPFADQHVIKVGKEPYQLRLTYEPEWVGDSQAKLTLLNKDTNENFEYELRGTGEEPLAEKEYIIECKLKESKQLMIELETGKKSPVTLSVEIELPYASGPTTWEVPTGGSSKYPLTLHPQLGGEFTGSITFKAENGMYWWYVLVLKVESNKFERHVEMTATCRRQVIQELELENPLNEQVVFQVVKDNEFLSGNSSIAVPPRSKAKYTLKFLPLREFKDKVQVSFLCSKIGDVVYDILLISEAPPVEKIGPIRCEIGKSEKAIIKLQNVTQEPARAIARMVDFSNFKLSSESVLIPPNETAEVEVYYSPSDLEKQDSTMVVFESKEIGSWTFKVSGVGIPPTKFPLTTIYGSLGQQSTSNVTFKNPFKDQIQVQIYLDAEDKSKPVFELVLKKSRVVISGQHSQDISLNFLPIEITDYHADIVVQLSDKVMWRFPILAHTESLDSESDFKLITKCHMPMEIRHSFPLPGITNIEPSESFEARVTLHNKEINSVLDRWLKIVPEVDTISKAEQKVRFLFKFEPHKPFKSYGEVVILKPSGGRWRSRVFFESTQPKIDDVIKITSTLNVTAQVQFKINFNLTNSKSVRDYRAEFTADSASEFTISPKKGELNPDDPQRNYVTFTVGYTPVEYGNVKIGRLVIQTAERYWNFQVEGTFPEYIPPNRTTGKLGLASKQANEEGEKRNKSPSNKRPPSKNPSSRKPDKKSELKSKIGMKF